MKSLKIISLILLFYNCKSSEHTFKDEYRTKVLYSEENGCYLFGHKSFIHYNPQKCFDINYGFSEKEFQQLREIYLDNFNRKSIKKYKKDFIIFKTYPVEEKSEKLVNNNYGLFRITGKVFAPNFYFLRTETSIYFYNCEDKTTLLEKLDSSKNIDIILKNKISLFIEEKCSAKDGLKWYSGAKFF